MNKTIKEAVLALAENDPELAAELAKETTGGNSEEDHLHTERKEATAKSAESYVKGIMRYAKMWELPENEDDPVGHVILARDMARQLSGVLDQIELPGGEKFKKEAKMMRKIVENMEKSYDPYLDDF